jgi:hypothetical protein
MGESNGYGARPKVVPAPVPPAPKAGALGEGTPSLEQRMRVEQARQVMVGWMADRHGVEDPTIPDVLACLIMQVEMLTAKLHDAEKRAGDAPRIFIPGR